MFRIILLAMIAPLVIACQTAPTTTLDPAPAAEFGEAITEPTDGIENETADD